MSSSNPKTAVRKSLQAFSADLRGFTQSLDDGLTSLRRLVNCQPCAGGGFPYWPQPEL